MASAVGPVPQMATFAPSKEKPVRSRYPTQPRPSVLKAMSASPFFTRMFAPCASFADAARAVAAASASGLYGVVMFTERKSRAARNAFASASVSQSIRSYSQGKPNFAYTALYITGDFE